MRPPRWMLRASAALAFVVSVQSAHALASKQLAGAMQAAMRGGEVSLEAQDDATVLPLVDDILFNNVSALAAVELLSFPGGDAPPKCNGGGPGLKVLFGLSTCFTSNEVQTLVDQTTTSTFATTPFLINDAEIARGYVHAQYVDNTCPIGEIVRHVQETHSNPEHAPFKLYLNIAKNNGQSYSSVVKSAVPGLATLDVRVCGSANLCGPADVVVDSVSGIGDAAAKALTAMYCSALAGSTPTNIGSDCYCTCPADRDISNNACVCRGELTPDAATGACGCTGGRTPTADNKCECTNGHVFSATENKCVCPSGTMLDGDACVPECYWKAGGTGYTCSWDSPSSEKTSLKLRDDCDIRSPASKDNYVADRRTNKYDPAQPARLGAPSNNPKISISATKRGSNSAAVTKATSWLNYVSSPSDLENDVTLSSLGVHDLSMTATDYRGEAKCFGCVAVRDDYPPTPETPCQLTDVSTTAVKNDFSSTNLQAYIDAEAQFTGFYAASNVKNNADAGDNERVDDKSMALTDFFDTVVPTTPLTSSCSWSSYVTDLLTSASSMTVEALSTAVLSPNGQSALVCERCCAKSITLKEKYYEYSCANPNPAEKTQGESSCTFNRCLKMPPKTLVTASSDITQAAKGKTQTTLAGLKDAAVGATGPTYVHRSVTCKDWTENCKVQTTLGDLLSKSASWHKDFQIILTGYNADNYVAWVYKVGAEGSWKAWSDGDPLSFSAATTDVYVQAWTRCGVVHEATYTVKIHLHSKRDVCKDFQLRWADNSPTPRTAPGDNSAVCAYPGSDFALMTFKYDSRDNVPHEDDKVKGKYTNIQCTVTVKESGSSTAVTALDMTPMLEKVPADPSTDPDAFEVIKQFAVELVKDPTTAINTAVEISCKFTFRYFDTTEDEDDTCPASFVFTDCDRPTLHTYSADVVCLPDKCGSPSGLPGAYESCAGDVFTTAGGSATILKSRGDACCTDCNAALQCVTPDRSTSVKRCEPPITGNLLLALAMDGTETGTAYADRAAAENEASTVSASSTVTMLLGASALVAVVALAAVAKARAIKKAAAHVDDAYVSLLD